MHHFFIDPKLIQNNRVTFPKEVAHQIKNVLRLTYNDYVAVLDNSGVIYYVKLRKTETDEQIVGEIEKSELAKPEPSIEVVLYFSLAAREKVDWILQKGTEVGVSIFAPYVSSRSLVRSTTISESKLARWMRIIREAAEQSGRGKLPRLNDPQILEGCFIASIMNNDLSLIAWENAYEKGLNIKEQLAGYAGKSLGLFVGPEGGFSTEEVTKAMQAGCKAVSLGSRILRMETASIIFPAIVLNYIEH